MSDVLPPHVVARLREGQTVICDRYPTTTILFRRSLSRAQRAGCAAPNPSQNPNPTLTQPALHSDIVGFTSISSNLPPERVSNMLDRFFARLDTLVVEHGLFKVETIGDAARTRSPGSHPLESVRGPEWVRFGPVRRCSEPTPFLSAHCLPPPFVAVHCRWRHPRASGGPHAPHCSLRTRRGHGCFADAGGHGGPAAGHYPHSRRHPHWQRGGHAGGHYAQASCPCIVCPLSM